MLLYRADIFEQQDVQPPTTWKEYHEVATRLMALERTGEQQTWHGTMEPLGPSWRGRMLLARAAAYARHRGVDDPLFDAITMEPLINSPPFVRALDELKAATAYMPEDFRELTPAQVYARLVGGQAAMAITWPGRRFAGEEDQLEARSIQWSLIACPGSDQIYRRFRDSWIPRPSDDAKHVPLLGIAGRLGSITRESRREQAAFRFLRWLAQADTSTTLFSDDQAAAPFRHSQLNSLGSWLSPTLSDQALKDYKDLVTFTDELSLTMVCPRLPAAQQYMEALDEGVRRVLAGEQETTAALDEVARQWHEITASRGVPAQQAAYQRHLGRAVP
jgi:multiple sugar transport system substrate-binding protein